MSNENVSLAILFADISGSTRLYETLGDKEATEGGATSPLTVLFACKLEAIK